MSEESSLALYWEMDFSGGKKSYADPIGRAV